MAKDRFKKTLLAGVAVATAIQSVPVMAVTTNTGVGATSKGQNVSAPSKSETSTKAVAESASIKDMKLVWSKSTGNLKDADPNREGYQEAKDAGTNIVKSRYSHKDGTPYTGLYLETYGDGTPRGWLVLDKDGFVWRDGTKSQFAWDNGRETADFMMETGPNLNPEDKKYYLGKTTTKNGGAITYIEMNSWVSNGKTWYRSNDKGICYRNQWFKETDGKWYYFGDDCKMVTNRLVDGYYIGADGSWQK